MRGPRFAVIAAAMLIGLAGCATAPTPVPSVPATPSTVASAPAPVPSGLAAPVEDPSLLSILPATISGVPVKVEPDSFAGELGDSTFVTNVAAAEFAVLVDGGDLASGMVARLRPGVFTDTFFRDWRDSYDGGACLSAGGVVGNAQAPLGGRTVYITSCVGDIRAYHVWLEGRGVLISLFSTGPRRFGEQLMSGLRP